MLLYNSRIHLFLGKLKSRRQGPFIFTIVYPYGTLEIMKDGTNLFKINGHKLKHYMGDTEKVEELTDVDLDEVWVNKAITLYLNIKSSTA